MPTRESTRSCSSYSAARPSARQIRIFQICESYPPTHGRGIAIAAGDMADRIPPEARAVAAPAITPAICGLRESAHDGDGLLYQFGNAPDLKKRMRRLLDRTQKAVAA